MYRYVYTAHYFYSMDEVNYADKTVAALFDHPAPGLRYSFYFPPPNETNPDADTQHDRNMARMRTASQEGLSMEYTRLKGWGIRATRKFFAGDLVLRYCGKLVSAKSGREIESALMEADIDDSYLFFFRCKNKEWCLDATIDDGLYGRMVNHSRLRPNCKPASVVLDQAPALGLFARRDIVPGEEVLYDYGETCQSVIDELPWLKES